MLKITNEQFRKFAKPAREAWISSAAQHLHRSFPDYFATLNVSDADLRPICRATEEWAEQHGVTGERDTLQLCCVSVSLGHRFWHDPRFRGYVRDTLEDQSLEREAAVRALSEKTSIWLSTLWHEDQVADFGARLAQQLRRGADLDQITWQTLLPGHLRLFDMAAHQRFVAWLSHQVSDWTPDRRVAFVALALVHGSGWMNDPQYTRLTTILHEAPTSAALADALANLYGRLG